MTTVRQIGRRAWLARLGGGALAVIAGLKFGGAREGYGIRIGLPDDRVAAAQDMGGTDMTPYDTRPIPLGQNDFTTAYVLVRGGEAAIVDTGVAGSADRIGEVIQQAGLGWDAVKHVILTHYHGDHAGSIRDVLGRAAGATPWAGADDIPNLRGLLGVQPAADGAEIFGLQVVSTPGHTAGHISIFDPVGSALVLGDAAINAGGTLSLASPQNTADMDGAKESLRKIAGLSFETAWFMHGRPIEGGAAGAFQQFVATMDMPDSLAHGARTPAHDHVCL